jgi:hypothetical protein
MGSSASARRAAAAAAPPAIPVRPQVTHVSIIHILCRKATSDVDHIPPVISLEMRSLTLLLYQYVRWHCYDNGLCT